MTTELDDAKYISFTTYKKDGTAVPAPVWVVPFEGGYAFTTEASSFKVKRIRNNPSATVAVCNFRGALRAGATVVAGTAEVLDEAASNRVNRAIRRKYWLAYHVAIAPGNLWRRVRGRHEPHTAVKFTVTG